MLATAHQRRNFAIFAKYPDIAVAIRMHGRKVHARFRLRNLEHLPVKGIALLAVLPLGNVLVLAMSMLLVLPSLTMGKSIKLNKNFSMIACGMRNWKTNAQAIFCQIPVDSPTF